MKYKAQAPLRIDFGGGWTDVPFFAEAEQEGGAVLNAAIDVYAQGYIIRPYSQLVPVTRGAVVDQEGSVRTSPMSKLLRRVTEGEANVVRYELDLPAGAGLGGSAAQTLLWLTLVKSAIANVSNRQELAERAWRIENELGIIGGKQDHYCSAVGGINFMTFGEKTAIESLKLSLATISELEARLALFYTGQSHLSGDIHEAVWQRYREGDDQTVKALRSMRQIARQQRQALLSSDLATLGELINQNWIAQTQLHPSISNARIDALVQAARENGAIGVKATGAGGGGCLLCLVETGAGGGLTEAMREAGGIPIPFRFDWFGVHLTKG